MFNFPVRPVMPVAPERPVEADTDEAALAAFNQMMEEYGRQLGEYGLSTNRYFQTMNHIQGWAASDGRQRFDLQKKEDQAISQVIKHIAPEVKRERIWDPALQKWVVREIRRK
jgi:hypothetical protein